MPKKSWSTAYLEQARSDWKLFEFLSFCRLHSPLPEYEIEASHTLHYLQMATEKLGKAFLLINPTTAVDEVNRTHEAFADFVRKIPVNHTVANLTGSKSVASLKRFVDACIPLAREIEKLAPALASGGPNPEYPWDDVSAREIRVPAMFDFEFDRRLGEHTPFLKLIAILLTNFERLV